MTDIRIASPQDREAIREVHLQAFPEEERGMVSGLAIDLLEARSEPDTFALVAEREGTVVGHVGFSPVSVDDQPRWRGFLLAPLAVRPDVQHQGIGSALIQRGLRRLAEDGVQMLFVYGDPRFYGRFGFSGDAAADFLPPCDLQQPIGWQAIVLNDGEPPPLPVRLTCVAALCDPNLW
jgi:putative acetyltransferase